MLYARYLGLLTLLLPAYALSRPAMAKPVAQAGAGALPPVQAQPATGKAGDIAGVKQAQPKIIPKVRPQCPIRLGGVFLRGLGDKPLAQNGGAEELSNANRDWVAANCDVAAFNAVHIQPDTFRAMTKAQPLFTPLLYVYASTLYEQSPFRGSVGGWQPAMTDWTLRDAKGAEVKHPDPGGHWMDFGNVDWAAHWRAQAAQAVGRYGAQGVVAAELPLGNTFVPDTLQKYKTTGDRLAATTQWLRAARSPQQFLLVPSAIGFDSLAGHPTLPIPPGAEEPELKGRVWDDLWQVTSGAWCEGWVMPYWSGKTLPDAQWEVQIEAADRAARNDQVFLACAAYHNDEELEYVLASLLMAYHAQGRLCVQPMPLRPNQSPDAGYSLDVFRKEITDKANYFNLPIGVAFQERHALRVEGGDVWRRTFQGADVYVNSDDTRTKTLRFSGPMLRLNGKTVRQIVLPPHRGAIMLHIQDED